MTEQRLRDLLHESVADVSTADLVDAAWVRAGRIRRRRVLAVGAGAAAVVVAIVGTLALVDRPHPAPQPPVTTDTGSPTPMDDRADTKLGDYPVWWSPDAEAEASLPSLEPGRTELPPVIDLGALAVEVADDPIDRALGAFAVFDDDGVDRVLLLADDGSYRTLDVSSLSKVAKPNGYELDPETDSMLSPDGRTLMFPQDGHVMVFDLAAGSWRRIETGDDTTAYAMWISGEQIYLPPTAEGGPGPVLDVDGTRQGDANLGGVDASGLGRTSAYGRWRTGPDQVAQSFDMGQGIMAPHGDLTPLEFLVVDGDQGRMVLAFLWPGEIRWLRCCPVAGWLDGHTVVYESRKTEPQLIAWTVGTHEFRVVSSLTGFTAGQEAYVASFARMWE